MEIKKFTTNATDWYFTRIFMHFQEGEGALDDANPFLKRLLRSVGIIFLLVIVSGILSWVPDFPFKYAILFLSFIAWVFLLIRTGLQFFKFMKDSRDDYEQSSNYPVFPNQDIDLYLINDEGIYVNQFNQTELKDMVFIRWDLVEKIQIGYTNYHYLPGDDPTAKKQSAEKYVKRLFNQAREKLGSFPYEPRVYYHEYTSIYLYTKNKLVSQLPLPPSWDKETMKRLMKELKNVQFKIMHEEKAYENFDG